MDLSRASTQPADRASSARLFLGALVAVVLVAGLTLAGIEILDLRRDGGATATDEPGATLPPEVVLPEGQTLVSGAVTRFAAEGAVLPPISLPLTITTPARGEGAGGRIEGAVVDGATSSIVWDAGRPLELSGSSAAEALELAPLRIDIEASEIRISLDGPFHGFAPGRYLVDTPVAVGSTGLARPLDRVGFEATDATTIAFAGGATVTLPARQLPITGPGKLLLEGTFEIATRGGKQSVRKIEFGEGAFELSLTPADGGYALTATLQGPIRLDG